MDRDFAGLSTSSDQNPSFTFSDNGTYPVCLTVTNADNDTNAGSGNVTPAYTNVGFNYNSSLDDIRPGFAWPIGDVILDGIPFSIPEGSNIWNSHDPWVTGPNPRTLDIPVNKYGIDQVYTLINTIGGQPGPTVYAWIEFWGDNGAYYRKDLVGNVDIRDYNLDGWTNSINGTTTINVLLGNQRHS